MRRLWSDMPPATEDFTGKVAIVTGGAQGIGFAIAKALADRGARIALFDVNSSAADDAARRLCPEGQGALAVKADVADETAVTAAVGAVMDQWGQIDILVNNAGIQFNCASLELRAE